MSARDVKMEDREVCQVCPPARSGTPPVRGAPRGSVSPSPRTAVRKTNPAGKPPPKDFLPNSDSEDDTDSGPEDEPFSLPPGWETRRGANGKQFTWSNGETTTGSIATAWELHARGSSSDALPKPPPLQTRRPASPPRESKRMVPDSPPESARDSTSESSPGDDDEEEDDSLISVAALLDLLEIPDDDEELRPVADAQAAREAAARDGGAAHEGGAASLQQPPPPDAVADVLASLQPEETSLLFGPTEGEGHEGADHDETPCMPPRDDASEQGGVPSSSCQRPPVFVFGSGEGGRRPGVQPDGPSSGRLPAPYIFRGVGTTAWPTGLAALAAALPEPSELPELLAEAGIVGDEIPDDLLSLLTETDVLSRSSPTTFSSTSGSQGRYEGGAPPNLEAFGWGIGQGIGGMPLCCGPDAAMPCAMPCQPCVPCDKRTEGSDSPRASSRSDSVSRGPPDDTDLSEIDA